MEHDMATIEHAFVWNRTLHRLEGNATNDGENGNIHPDIAAMNCQNYYGMHSQQAWWEGVGKSARDTVGMREGMEEAMERGRCRW